MSIPICYKRLATVLYIVVSLPNLTLTAKPLPLSEEIGCLMSGFSGYFHPARWQSCDLSARVGGAAVPSLLVEGANHHLIAVADLACRDFSVLIPADAYVSFKWEDLGSSLSSPPTSTTFLAFVVNGESQPLAGAKGAYTSTFLKKGDRITFRLPAGASTSIAIRDFEFRSNALSLITELVIPAQIELYLTDFSQLEQLTQPHLVGQPYLDADGDEQTTDDQILLLEVETTLDISWEDYITYDEQGTTLIIRKWAIYDHCAGNEVHQQQYLRCYPKSIHEQ